MINEYFYFSDGKCPNNHSVVDCSHSVMRIHCYWPIVSDLNNVLSHKPIAIKFMSDTRLIQEWFSFLSLFQGKCFNIINMNKFHEFFNTP